MSERDDIFQKAMNEGHSAAWDQEWDKAVSAYRRALQEIPDQPKALNSLGLALYQLGRLEESLQIYLSVAKISPDDPVPMEKVAQLSERLGNLKNAIDAAFRAGDLYLQQRDTQKALENWVRVTNLNPQHTFAHLRLAQVHEKLGHVQQAVTEYLAVASILQRAGNAEKTKEMVEKAQSLLPNSPEVKQAQTLLKTGQLLPQPIRGKGGTGPIRMAQVKQLQTSHASRTSSGLDPVSEARQKALTRLAAGEPLAYILGWWEFFGRRFRLTPVVLIPRPETELLVELALELIRSGHRPNTVVDVGTGSGCIAVAIAKYARNAELVATDVSPGGRRPVRFTIAISRTPNRPMAVPRRASIFFTAIP